MNAAPTPLAPDAPFSEDDYRAAGGFPEFIPAGEYGPLPCGCYLVALPFDPCGPCLNVLMMRKDVEVHDHTTHDWRSFTHPS